MRRLPPRLLTIAWLLGALPGQNDFDLDKRSPGTLGTPLRLAVANAPPNRPLLVMMSSSPGPTPLAGIDPGDPRSVDVGVEATPSWFSRFTSPQGDVDVTFLLPNVAAFHGLGLHYQTATLFGPGTLLDRIGNPVFVRFGVQGLPSTAPAVLVGARAFAAGTSIGRDFLIAGGGAGTLTTARGVASTVVWDSRRLQTRSGGAMGSPRASHLAVTLGDGRVLVIGGVDAQGNGLSSCELYDPATGTFAPAGSMAWRRALHAAVRLRDGRVMVAGGTTSMANLSLTIAGALPTVEIYNPAANSWSSAPSLAANRIAPSLTALPDGRVVVAGGVDVTTSFGVPATAASTTAVQIWSPLTNLWTGGAPMPSARAGHHHNQVTLPDGRLLLSGGIDVQNLTAAAAARSIDAADLYDPVANAWQATRMPTARSLHTATVLQGGTVVVCGGAQGNLVAPSPIAAVDVFLPAANLWAPSAPLLQPRSGHLACLQPDGLLVLFGGASPGSVPTTSIETLHP